MASLLLLAIILLSAALGLLWEEGQHKKLIFKINVHRFAVKSWGGQQSYTSQRGNQSLALATLNWRASARHQSDPHGMWVGHIQTLHAQVCRFLRYAPNRLNPSGS